MHFIKLVQWFQTGKKISCQCYLGKSFLISEFIGCNCVTFDAIFVFHSYSKHFLNVVDCQCDAINLFLHTEMLKNPEVKGQASLKKHLLFSGWHFYST